MSIHKSASHGPGGRGMDAGTLVWGGEGWPMGRLVLWVITAIGAVGGAAVLGSLIVWSALLSAAAGGGRRRGAPQRLDLRSLPDRRHRLLAAADDAGPPDSAGHAYGHLTCHTPCLLNTPRTSSRAARTPPPWSSRAAHPRRVRTTNAKVGVDGPEGPGATSRSPGSASRLTTRKPKGGLAC